MIRRSLIRHGYAATVTALIVAIFAVAAFLLVVAVPNLTGIAAEASPSLEAAASPAPTERSAMALSPIGVEMPANANCAACHLMTNGAIDTVGTKPIPVMAHPLQGWTDCTACHATASLVATAPGHTGLHKDDCLVCHKTQDAAASASVAPLRPHHVVPGQTCLSCHGSTAPLPTDMEGRTNCWVCHPGTDTAALFGNPTASPASSPAAPTPKTGAAASSTPAP